jgi:hypothetical protein
VISRRSPRGSGRRAGAWPDLGLAAFGPPDLVDHLIAEYGAPDDAALETAGLVVTALGDDATSLSAKPDGAATWARIRRDAYKTTRWRTRLGPAGADPISCEIEIKGLFGRSLVQSIVVEPLLSVALARRGAAMISASGVVVEGRVTAIAGISRSGKSSLALRAWGRGLELLADDRLVVKSDGVVEGFPRRLRVYPDLAATAPLAHERLGLAVRRRLAAMDVARRLTGGWVALPALVDAKAVGAGRRSAPLGRLVIVDRAEADPATRAPSGARAATSSIVEREDPEAVWHCVKSIVEHDLAWVASNGADWAAAASETESAQIDILRRAVDATGARLSIVTVPTEWPAARSIAMLARHLGLES